MAPFNCLSLYIHIPFCIKKCRYCDFYSEHGDGRVIDKFIDALAVEWDLAKNEYRLEGVPIATLFFGGVTPSLLSITQWNKIHDRLIRRLSLTDDCEWSIECNPDSFSREKAELWDSFGATRLTFGVQSFNERELRVLGRAHTAARAVEVMSDPVLARFSSIGVDLIYGLPGQTAQSLETSLNTVFSYDVVNHLSLYELAVNDRTMLGRHRRLLPLPDEDTCMEMVELIMSSTREHGFDRYEVSNFARPGHRCRHNMAYWRHAPYIGLGPSAHSYLPPLRFSNVNDTFRYISSLERGKLPIDFSEILDKETLSREMVFLGLRTVEGINEDRFYENVGLPFCSPARKPLLEKFVRQKYMTCRSPLWALTEKGMLFADAIARELL
ncbi:MAG: radical SAM family heme chaperone HemW [Chitinivibrionales bacterium]